MSKVDFFSKGIKFLNEAINQDNNKKYQEALNLYIRAFEYFVAGLKYSKNEKTNDLVRGKMKEFLERAEVIKSELKKEEPPETKKENNKEEKKENKPEEKKEIPVLDEETKRLRAALEDTILKEKPNLSWKDVAGLETAKTNLEEAVVLPQKFPQLFTGKRKPWKGILLYGPPGTGKSLLAKATAGITNSTFFSVSSSNLVSKWVGDSEKLVRQLFQLASENKPAIIFIDEIDSICGKRTDDENDALRRIKTEFLVQMQKVLDGDGVLVLGATNRPFDLDPAVRRRFEKRIYIPLPDEEARMAMIKLHIGNEPSIVNTKFLKDLAGKMEGYSGSDISVIARDVLMAPVRQAMKATHWKEVPNSKDPSRPYLTPCDPSEPGAIEMNLMKLSSDQLVLPEITLKDYERALEKNRPSVNAAELEMQEKFTRLYGIPQLSKKTPEQVAQELEEEKKQNQEEDDAELMEWTTKTTKRLEGLKKIYKEEKHSPKSSSRPQSGPRSGGTATLA